VRAVEIGDLRPGDIVIVVVAERSHPIFVVSAVRTFLKTTHLQLLNPQRTYDVDVDSDHSIYLVHRDGE
jgi:hypothetical protein